MLPDTGDENTETDGKRERKREGTPMTTKGAISQMPVKAVVGACGYQRHREECGKDDDAEQRTER